MKLTHKQKVRKANRLLARDEKSTYYVYENALRRKPRTSKFASRKWTDMADAKRLKMQRMRDKAFLRKHPEILNVKDTADSSAI